MFDDVMMATEGRDFVHFARCTINSFNKRYQQTLTYYASSLTLSKLTIISIFLFSNTLDTMSEGDTFF